MTPHSTAPHELGVGHVLVGTPVAAAVGLQSLRAGRNGCLGLAYHAAKHCHIGLKHRHDALNHVLSQLFGTAGRLKFIEPVGVFARGHDVHERPGHYLLADDGRDLFTDTSMVFANDLHVRVAVGERERVKVNKYGEKCRRAGAFFHPWCWRRAIRGRVQDHSQDHQEACDAGGS
jgi:hypothetical protein